RAGLAVVRQRLALGRAVRSRMEPVDFKPDLARGATPARRRDYNYTEAKSSLRARRERCGARFFGPPPPPRLARRISGGGAEVREILSGRAPPCRSKLSRVWRGRPSDRRRGALI